MAAAPRSIIATALASSLTTVSGLQITLDGSGTIATSQWSSLTGGSSLTVTGGSYLLSGLIHVNGSSLVTQNGGAFLGVAESDHLYRNR